jgi:hypothetical protein
MESGGRFRPVDLVQMGALVESSFPGLVRASVNRGMADPSVLLLCIKAIVARQLFPHSPEESSLSLC